MAERLSPLAHSRLGHGQRDTGESAQVAMRHPRPGSILQIVAWPGTHKEVRATIAELLGIEAPALGYAAVQDGMTIAALAPGRFLVSGEATDLAERFASLSPERGAVTDLSHARAIIRAEGLGVAEHLTQFIAIDTELSAFPPNRVAQTAIHHMDVLVHRLEESRFDLWVLRSFAVTLAHWISYGEVEWFGVPRVRNA